MNRRLTVAIAAIAALGIGAVGLVPTAGAAAKKNKIRITGGPIFKPGVMIGDNIRFNRTTTVKSGGTVKVINKGDPDAGPHTISLLKKSFLPQTIGEAEPCFEGQGVCAPLYVAHEVPENPEEPPGVLLFNAGAAGFDTMGDDKDAGDSVFIAPGQGGSLDVTADKGSTLTYFCAVHPWMQGKIKVK